MREHERGVDLGGGAGGDEASGEAEGAEEERGEAEREGRHRRGPGEEEREWIHNGDPFVTIKDSHGQRRDVRWSAVEQYRVIEALDA